MDIKSHQKNIMKNHAGLLTAAILLILYNGLIFSQNVTRGPYLQIGTPHSIIVKWRTDIFTDSQVKIGNSPGNLDMTFDNLLSTTEHEVLVDGLAPDTEYYYSIGSSESMLAGNDSSYFFLTSPQTGTDKPTRIWVLGDSGTKDDSARAVRDAYYNFTGERHTDLWLMLGDNAYDNGTDGEYQKAVFENMYENMLRKSVLWPTLGNHDDNTSSTPGPNPYFDIFTLPTNGEAGGVASAAEAYYSFDYGNIHFVVLNSTTSSFGNANSAMRTWLEEDVLLNDKLWTIAFWHHPPYSKGSHDSDAEGLSIMMRENALPILESAGVDLVLTGHSHSYERSYLINGHYGKSNTFAESMKIDAGDGRPNGDGIYEKDVAESMANKGTVYIVSGSSGVARVQGNLDHPAMVTSFSQLGSLVLDIDRNLLQAKFIDDKGNIDEYFTIKKNGPPQISISPQLHNFGEVFVDSGKTQNFVIENTGTSVLNISNIFFAGGDSLAFNLEMFALPDSLEPNALLQFTVTFLPDSSGQKSTTMRLESNDPTQSSLDVNLLGTALLLPPQISVSPEFHDFGEVIVDSIATQIFVINNSGGTPLHLTQIHLIDNDSLQFNLDTLALPDTLEPDSSLQFKVIFLPDSSGQKSTTMRLESNDPAQSSLDVNLLGTALLLPPQISVSPEFHDFGEVIVDSIATQILVINNSGGTPLHLTQIHLIDNDSLQFNLDTLSLPDTLEPDSSLQFKVIFKPTLPGAWSAVLQIKSNDSGNGKLSVDLSGTALMLPPIISITPDFINFGNVIIDSTEAQNFTIWNTGGSGLLLSSIQFLGADSNNFYVDSFVVPSEIAVNDSQNVIINFKPKSEGVMTVNLRIGNNDIAQNPAIITLEGTGVKPLPVNVDNSEQDIFPDEVSLSQNYPNPFNNETQIEYAIPEPARVRIIIYNVMGQKVRLLVDEMQEPGYKRINWDGRSDNGSLIVSGVYFFKMEVNNTKLVQKILLQK